MAVPHKPSSRNAPAGAAAAEIQTLPSSGDEEAEAERNQPRPREYREIIRGDPQR
jgi:hypothetical protein